MRESSECPSRPGFLGRRHRARRDRDQVGDDFIERPAASSSCVQLALSSGSTLARSSKIIARSTGVFP